MQMKIEWIQIRPKAIDCIVCYHKGQLIHTYSFMKNRSMTVAFGIKKNNKIFSLAMADICMTSLVIPID